MLTADSGIRLISAQSGGDLKTVQTLFAEYANSLSVDLCFQNFEQELLNLPGDYAKPRGDLLLATVNGIPAGCCALRALDTVDYPNACEMKRLYVSPKFRGLRIGRLLAESIMDSARLAAYDCILLDTLDEMEAARALYKELNFEEIPPYYFNPVAGAHYLKSNL